MKPGFNNPLRRRPGEPRQPDWALGSILALAALARLAPLFLSGYLDPDSYYHLRLTQLFLKLGTLPQYDPLSYGGRPYTYYPLFHATAAALSTLWGVDPTVALGALGVAAGIAATLATFALCKRLVKVPEIAKAVGEHASRAPYLASLWMALMPGAVARSLAFARPDAFALAFAPLLMLLVLDRNLLWAGTCFFVLMLLHLPSALVLLAIVGAVLLANWLAGSKLDWQVGFACGLGAAVGGLYYLQFPVSQYFSPAVYFSSELASFSFPFILFYGSVALAFAILCLHAIWQSKSVKAWVWPLAWLACGLALVLAATRNIVFLAPPLALFAGLGFAAAMGRSGKHASLVMLFGLLACAVAFGAYATTIKQDFTPGDFAAAAYLATPLAGPAGAGMVASAWDRGHAIAELTSRPVFADGYFEYSPDAVGRIDLEYSSLAGSAPSLASLKADGVGFFFVDSQLFAGELGPIGLPGYASEQSSQASALFDSGGENQSGSVVYGVGGQLGLKGGN